MMALHTRTLAELSVGLESGEFTSVELTQALLDRIALRSSELNALITVTADEALAAAIGSVLEDASVAASLIAGGELRSAELSMENLARLYLDIYADLA